MVETLKLNIIGGIIMANKKTRPDKVSPGHREKKPLRVKRPDSLDKAADVPRPRPKPTLKPKPESKPEAKPESKPESKNEK